ncbi:MAG: methyl-accepting chemotaxis protein [Pseudomonadota bacterium]
MTIRKILTITTLILVLLVVILAGISFVNSWQNKKIYLFAKESSQTISLLLTAAGNWAVERGVTNSGLNSASIPAKGMIDIISQRRQQGDEAYEQAMQQIAGFEFVGKKELVYKLTEAHDAVIAARAEADKNLKLSQFSRNSKILKSWVPTASKRIMISQDLRFALTKAAAKAHPEIGRQSKLKHFSWLMSEFAGRERAIIGGIISSGSEMSTDRLQTLSKFRGNVETGWNLLKKISASSNQELRDTITKTEEIFFGPFEELRKEVYKSAINGEDFTIDAKEWIAQSTKAIDTILVTQAVSTKETASYVEKLITKATIELLFSSLLLLFSIATALFMFWVVRNRVVQPLDLMVGSMEKMSKGENTDIPFLESVDEVGNIARALKDIDEIGQTALRVQGAIDSSTANIMMTNLEYEIIFVNPSLKSLLAKHDSQIKSVISHFNKDKINGENIHIFNIDNLLKKSLLDNLSVPYKCSLNFGKSIFDLTISPILNAKDERLGTVLEWVDVTQERILEAEISTVVSAAAKGDFTQRLDIKGKDGFFLLLCEGINEIATVSLEGLTEVKETLQYLAEGNLTKKIDNNYEGLFDDIKQALNNTIAQLLEMVEQIQQSSSSVNDAANEIASGSQDLAHRTESQAATLGETSSSMEQLAKTISQNTKNAEEANQLSSEAADTANRGSDVVKQAVNAVQEIQASSEKIADIISTIDDIAFQTNLLALNAAVEAARAGEAGKGFAVVASEVRSLAGRSAEASKEIRDLISNSVVQVKDGVELVNQSGETLNEIVESIKNVDQLVSSITAASHDQTKSSEDVSQAVLQMDHATQENAALVEENTAAAQSMSEQASNLNKLMKFFLTN